MFAFIEKFFFFFFFKFLKSFGAVDPNAIANLNNAIAAQLNTDIYMFPCVYYYHFFFLL